MINKTLKGQEAIEFILIAVLVFFICLGVMMFFGGKLVNFFNSESSVVQSSKKSSPRYTTSSEQRYSDPIDYSAGKGKTSMLAGQIVTQYPDGSMVFTVGSQKVNLSKDVIDNQNIAMETAGTVGAGDLVKEIAYMINKYKSEYPDGDVPVEILYGNGSRQYTGPSGEFYKGKASVNATTIMVGNHFIVMQKDQMCSVAEKDQECDYPGKFRIESTADSKSNFNAKVSGELKGGETVSGNIPSGTFATTANGGVKITSNYKQVTDGLVRDFDWNFDFTKEENIYKI